MNALPVQEGSTIVVHLTRHTAFHGYAQLAGSPALAHFYAQLLGWDIETADPGWATLKNPDGGIRMGFHIEDIYVPPVWPAKPGEQQMMMHLEIQVDDLDAGCAHARACGATLAEFQPQDDVRVHLDPDGHPFCLYRG